MKLYAYSCRVNTVVVVLYGFRPTIFSAINFESFDASDPKESRGRFHALFCRSEKRYPASYGLWYAPEYGYLEIHRR